MDFLKKYTLAKSVPAMHAVASETPQLRFSKAIKRQQEFHALIAGGKEVQGRPWFQQRGGEGKWYLSPRYGSKSLRTENGEPVIIELPDIKGVGEALDVIMTATENGELDTQLEQLSQNTKAKEE